MFYKKLCQLCDEKDISPTSFVKSILKMSSGNLSKWKNGAPPKYETIEKTANYFNVSVEYLMGNTDIKEKPAAQEGNELLDRLRSDPKYRELVRLLLSADDEDLDLLIKIAKRIDSEKQAP